MCRIALPLIFVLLNSYACQSNTIKTSVIIPCFYGHFQHLDELMNALCNQTVLPDEIVISLSEIDKLDPILVENFENKQYPFPVKLIKHQERLWAGPNRNSACQHASGDIFICQDADDLPHPQRIEIIKYFF